MPDRLGSTFKIATLAPTGHPNAGNWICEFSPKDLGVSQSKFQCYHIVVSGGPIGSKFTVYQNNNLYDSVFPGWDTSWDPNNPMKLANGDTVSFWWNANTVNSAATVWLYFENESPL